ncbi:MAG: hypothetical protein FJ102_25615 [Deltaproteobacteria bacterium]|nr:hypothetical protein [Deltaproteobacteria bacterium]
MGVAPVAAIAPALTEQAGTSVQTQPRVVALQGDHDWLVAAISAILDVALPSGRVSIDLADVRALFSGRGTASGVVCTGANLTEATDTALAAASSRRPARRGLLHVTGSLGMPLCEVHAAADRLQSSEDELVCCFYPARSDTFRVTLIPL